jgi:glycosyltransferase involved in cell wall biosynthesis
MMDYMGHLRNIGLFQSETSNFAKTMWPTKLNSMDEVWVTCKQQREAAIKSGVTKKIKIIPQPCDTSKYSKSYKPLGIPGTENKFLFYFIGETNRRKGIEHLLKAFHLEFNPDEQVELVMKINSPGMSEKESILHMNHYCNEIKNGLKLWPSLDNYKREIVIAEYLSPENIMRLHNSCDCFVMPSYGEAWCIPAFDAMCMGKTPIITDDTGMKEYIGDDNGYVVKSYKEPVFGMMDTFNDLYTGREEWCRIDVLDLRKKMREAYQNHQERRVKSKNGIDSAYSYSYEKLGQQMKEILCQAQ